MYVHVKFQYTNLNLNIQHVCKVGEYKQVSIPLFLLPTVSKQHFVLIFTRGA